MSRGVWGLQTPMSDLSRACLPAPGGRLRVGFQPREESGAEEGEAHGADGAEEREKRQRTGLCIEGEEHGS